MHIIINLLIGIVIVIHLYIVYIEMFAWETIGKKTFKTLPNELFKPTKKLAANQGLYNGFLAVGLLWSFVINDITWKNNVAIYFLLCVIIAGVYGSISVSKKIFYVQALPAILALIAILIQYYF